MAHPVSNLDRLSKRHISEKISATKGLRHVDLGGRELLRTVMVSGARVGMAQPLELLRGEIASLRSQ
jgi:hypothetical protein